MFTITINDIIKVIPDIDSLNENPRNLNGTCLYTDKYENHCLVGEILTELRIPVPQADEETNGKAFYELIDEGFFEKYNIQFDVVATTFLQECQTYADQDDTLWGVALKQGAKSILSDELDEIVYAKYKKMSKELKEAGYDCEV